jgi:hypothetical protein
MTVAHRRLSMTGCDQHEVHRVAPLELLYDVALVVAFGAASNEAAGAIVEGPVRSGLVGFGFAMFAVAWTWIQSRRAVVLTIAVPLSVYILRLSVVYRVLTREVDRLRYRMAGGPAVVAVAIAPTEADASIAMCLLVLTVAPAVTVVGCEFVGHRDRATMMIRSGVEMAPD